MPDLALHDLGHDHEVPVAAVARRADDDLVHRRHAGELLRGLHVVRVGGAGHQGHERGRGRVSVTSSYCAPWPADSSRQSASRPFMARYSRVTSSEGNTHAVQPMSTPCWRWCRARPCPGSRRRARRTPGPCPYPPLQVKRRSSSRIRSLPDTHGGKCARHAHAPYLGRVEVDRAFPPWPWQPRGHLRPWRASQGSRPWWCGCPTPGGSFPGRRSAAGARGGRRRCPAGKGSTPYLEARTGRNRWSSAFLKSVWMMLWST